MLLYKVPDKQIAARVVTARLEKELGAKRRVLWLLSGGSNISLEVATMATLPLALQAHLTVSLCDERYGPYGHKDSNLQQLWDAGLPKGPAQIIPVLTPQNLSMEETAAQYAGHIHDALKTADCIILQLGMGTDGHIAGILPDSPAVKAAGIVTSYTTEQYQRITLTFEALRQATTAYVLAFGADKQEQLTLLQDEDIAISKQPAQILKQIPESYVYNDQVGTYYTNVNGSNV